MIAANGCEPSESASSTASGGTTRRSAISEGASHRPGLTPARRHGPIRHDPHTSPAENQVNGGRRPGYARPVAGQAELTSRQRRSLAEDGYLLLPSLLAADVVAALAARLDELARAIIAERDAAGEQWDSVVSVRLDPADPGYGPLVRQPLLFSAADAVIGPGCVVDGLGLRAPPPGCGRQGLDPDFFPGQRTSGPWPVVAP